MFVAGDSVFHHIPLEIWVGGVGVEGGVGWVGEGCWDIM